MAVNYIPLDKEKHSALKVNLAHNFAYAKDTHLSAVTVREVAQLATCMPIAFIKDPSQEQFHMIAMLGVDQNQNLYFNEDKWVGHAVPLNIQRFPFDVRPDGDKLGVFIDENSELFTEDGEALFDDKGEPSDFLKNRQQLLGDIANSELATGKFIKEVVELDLLEELDVVVIYADGSQRNVTGVHSISESKLNEISDEKIVELKKSGFLGVIYALLLSLGQLNRLVQLSAHLDNPIRGIQVKSKVAGAEEAKA